MNIPTDLAIQLIEFVLDNRSDVLILSMNFEDETQRDAQARLKAGFDEILKDALDQL